MYVYFLNKDTQVINVKISYKYNFLVTNSLSIESNTKNRDVAYATSPLKLYVFLNVLFCCQADVNSSVLSFTFRGVIFGAYRMIFSISFCT